MATPAEYFEAQTKKEELDVRKIHRKDLITGLQGILTGLEKPGEFQPAQIVEKLKSLGFGLEPGFENKSEEEMKQSVQEMIELVKKQDGVEEISEKVIGDVVTQTHEQVEKVENGLDSLLHPEGQNEDLDSKLNQEQQYKENLDLINKLTDGKYIDIEKMDTVIFAKLSELIGLNLSIPQSEKDRIKGVISKLDKKKLEARIREFTENTEGENSSPIPFLFPQIIIIKGQEMTFTLELARIIINQAREKDDQIQGMWFNENCVKPTQINESNPAPMNLSFFTSDVMKNLKGIDFEAQKKLAKDKLGTPLPPDEKQIWNWLTGTMHSLDTHFSRKQKQLLTSYHWRLNVMGAAADPLYLYSYVGDDFRLNGSHRDADSFSGFCASVEIE